MTITPIEHERGVFEVQGGEDLPYRVDMTFFNGNSCCDCMDFRTRKKPLLEAGHRGRDLSCKHIVAVRNWIVDQMIRAWIEEEREKP